jgi:hypothetical protein
MIRGLGDIKKGKKLIINCYTLLYIVHYKLYILTVNYISYLFSFEIS